MPEVNFNTVRDGVNAALDASFPEVPIAGEEIKQGLQEPYFFVKLLDAAQDQELGRRYRRFYSFDIHYFGTDNRDMHEAAEKLYEALESVDVDGILYRGTGMHHEIFDRVLHFFVDFNFMVSRPAPAVPAMGRADVQEGLRT